MVYYEGNPYNLGQGNSKLQWARSKSGNTTWRIVTGCLWEEIHAGTLKRSPLDTWLLLNLLQRTYREISGQKIYDLEEPVQHAERSEDGQTTWEVRAGCLYERSPHSLSFTLSQEDTLTLANLLLANSDDISTIVNGLKHSARNS